MWTLSMNIFLMLCLAMTSATYQPVSQSLMDWSTSYSGGCTRYPEFMAFRPGTHAHCRLDTLGSLCADSGKNSCAYSVPNGRCNPANQICECAPGYHITETIFGEKQCLQIKEGSVCKPGPRADMMCKDRLDHAEAKCELTSCTCVCPAGLAWSGAGCDLLLFTDECAACISTGGVCYDNNRDGFPEGCHCPGKSYSSGASTQEMQKGCDMREADIDEQCTRGLTNDYIVGSVDLNMVRPVEPSRFTPGIVCRDINAKCLHAGTLSSRHICKCKPGYLPVRAAVLPFNERFPDGPSETRCVRKLVVLDDPTCAVCISRGGQCYDTNYDLKMDGCLCPSSRSTIGDNLPEDHCAFENVRVICNALTMRVCLIGNNGPINIPPKISTVINELNQGTATAYIREMATDKRCQLERQGNGEYCIDLSTDGETAGDFLKRCGARVVKYSKNQINYMTWIIVQRNLQKMTIKDFRLHAYCKYDVIKNIYNGSIVEDKKDVAVTGQILSPDLSMHLEDKNDLKIEFLQSMSLGEPVRLVISYVDNLGIFTHLKAEICIISDMPHLDIPDIKTILFIDRGCPVVNAYIAKSTNFHTDLSNPGVIRTRMFPLCKFLASDYVFFHCAVRVCRDAQACAPRYCPKVMNKRSVTGEGPISLPKTLSDIEATGEYKMLRLKREVDGAVTNNIEHLKENLDSPYLSMSNTAVKVIAPEEYEKTAVDERNARMMPLNGDNVTTRKVLHRAPSTVNFSTIVICTSIGTAVLSFILAVGSFYLVNIVNKPRGKDQEFVVKE